MFKVMRQVVFGVMAVVASVWTAGCVSERPITSLEATVTLAGAGGSRYRIVIPGGHPSPGLRRYWQETANCLQRCIAEGSGVTLPVVADDAPELQDGAPFISLGETRQAAAAGLRQSAFQHYEGIVRIRGGRVYLYGHDGHAFGREEKAAHFSRYYLGSVKAAVVFMEEYLGVRFLLPGENGVAVPSRAEIRLPAEREQPVRPQLVYASVSSTGDLFYSMANNGLGTGGFHSYGGHSYYDAVPAAVYAASHPEYFALRGAVRDPKGNHLCISNSAVQELIYAEMLRRLDAGAEGVQLAQTDGYFPCGCQACQAFGGVSEPGEKLWILHRRLAERLLRERPGKKVWMIAYGPTALPPRSFRSFPANTMIELCNYTEADFARWRGYEVPQGFTVYLYFWGSYKLTGFAPKRTAAYCKKMVQLFSQNKVRGVYRCGFGENMGLEGPVYYVFGKLWDNPDADENLLLDEYYRSAFQEAYGPMRAFYGALYRQLEAYSILEAERAAVPPRALLAYVFAPEVLESMSKNLDRARAVAVSEKVRKRLDLIATEFAYCRNLAEIVHLYSAYRCQPSAELFDRLGGKVEERNALIERCFPDGRNLVLKDWPAVRLFGHPTRELMQSNGRLGAVLGAPVNWNIPLLREKGILPGVGKKVMTVSRAVGEISAEDFTGGAWQAAAWQEVLGIQLNEVREKTRFKMLYDQEHLYIGVETELPAAVTITPTGRDGSCYTQDCLEVMLDPTGSRERYFHFIFGPVANSCFDAAFGLIDDPLHPNFNQTDRNWNGAWDYSSRRAGDTWYGFFKVPFATLQAAKPLPGTTWTFNLGRESFRDKHMVELSLWSPNLETMSFHDRDAFGELIFAE